ncbi:MAG TPA: GGDEF domain-containing protein [Caldimonas sp.]|nr:GGDEF domain-containing protein [Caldimonas sp.]
MDMTRPSPLSKATDVPVAQVAKAALRRLAVERLEPTPENYERAYRHEAGDSSGATALPARAHKLVERLALRALDGDAAGAAEVGHAIGTGRWEQAEHLLDMAGDASSQALATLIERIVRGVERGGHNWTPARRKEGIHRVLAGSRSDSRRLQQRLAQLVNSWEGDGAATDVDIDDAPADAVTQAAADAAIDRAAASPASSMPEPDVTATATTAPEATTDAAKSNDWKRIALSLAAALRQALPMQDDANRELGSELARLADDLSAEGATALRADATEALVQRAERVLQHRHHLFEQLGKLCHELTSSLTDIAENDSWVKGQCEAMRLKIEEGLTARGVRQVSDMLHHARARHAEIKGEREKAREALKLMIQQMLAELGELGSKTGDFHQSVGRYAEVIEEADSLESLTGVVREMVTESRAVQSLVQQTQARLQEEHSKATDLSERVVRLEDEMRRLSDEVSTDQLTQIANRRGLMQAFSIEQARLERNGGHLSIGLLDIDNFKRLNDELGHSAGDEALKSLAAIVSKTLRPTDRVARYGGEEFVVLLPETPVDEGEQILTRLQRSLTGGLFMHKDKQVFVTFSAGVTGYRLSERIEIALERADQALYEAKRTGKNRTCIG